jgi:threonine dehydratase
MMKDVAEMDIPTYEDMLAAHERIAPHIRRTPILTSDYLNELTGAQLFFKCENLQEPGAFKVRGATNAVFGLTEEQAKSGRGHAFEREPRAVPVLRGRAARASPATW